MTEDLIVADCIDLVADSIADLPQDRPVLVGVDGVDGSGKTTFAAALRERVVGRPSTIIHLDDFLNPPHLRHARGRDSAEGFWLDTYDYPAFRRVLADSAEAGANAAIIVEGMFLHRDELANLWARATIVIDNTDLATPRRIEPAEACANDSGVHEQQ